VSAASGGNVGAAASHCRAMSKASARGMGWGAVGAALGIGIGIGAFALGVAQAAAPTIDAPKSGAQELLPKVAPVTAKPKTATTTAPASAVVEPKPYPRSGEPRRLLLCRGPFVLDGGQSPRVRARRTDVAPGKLAQDLGPGRCAISTSLARPGEPVEIAFNYWSHGGGDDLVRHDLARNLGAFTVLSACALDDECIMAAWLDSGGEGTSERPLRSLRDEAPTIWKRGYFPSAAP
jgi:hypothetical protein